MKLQNITLIAIGLLLTSCVSRLSRPLISGVITDFNGHPINQCHVGEVVTDQNGMFTLSEKRYSEFIFHLEAPPLMVSEIIHKKGYEDKNIYSFSSFGGSGRKGLKWNLDTIRLKEDRQKQIKLNNTKWNFSTNKTMDTICFIKSTFNDLCKTKKCHDFYYMYDQYSDNYLKSSGKNNLPEGIIRRLITVSFNNNEIIKLNKVTQFGHKDGTRSISEANDTIQTHGKWISNGNKMYIESDLTELKGSFELKEVDYEYMMWIKKFDNKTDN
ncbi:hypothetical protein [Psychroserpens sp. NJDZ02]|uniref:hypothetical protein n=1 Tax=Psychroserpens sp. NJDZ02 TaxID=2570561 RepID=UPI0010A84FE0|nr:hypothetical protein [Psychroserpens sp. NJDZ02]QCE43391.1 hypothetical protein E9099_18845 [Psychroserpens sp. NJDZ02]